MQRRHLAVDTSLPYLHGAKLRSLNQLPDFRAWESAWSGKGRQLHATRAKPSADHHTIGHDFSDGWDDSCGTMNVS